MYYSARVARYSISYTPLARADLRYLGRRAEALVIAAAERYLADAPVPALGQEGMRKVLDPNPLDAHFRLRVGEYRAYYTVNEDTADVEIVRVGHKPRETVFFQGQPSAMRD
jgi:mRNA-degrading endonuclease RelE of RelBE toxin-antitoxin system